MNELLMKYIKADFRIALVKRFGSFLGQFEINIMTDRTTYNLQHSVKIEVITKDITYDGLFEESSFNINPNVFNLASGRAFQNLCTQIEEEYRKSLPYNDRKIREIHG